MQCPDCAHGNPEGANFCSSCGTSIRRACPSCGMVNAASAISCSRCAAAIDSQRLPSRSGEAENRQLTVMFCDLVGSTELAESCDPEDLRVMIRAYQSACAEIIRGFDGRIAQYLGDGLLVYFGYPQAHEDDPTRGVNAALAIVEEMPQLSARVQGDFGVAGTPHLKVRVGVHTGHVVVGEVGAEGRREQLAIGDTVNIASRLLSVTAPNQVVISPATRKRVEGLFDFEDLGESTLRGISEPIQVSRVLNRRAVQNRFDAASRGRLTPLVGRATELANLCERWSRARRGRGQVVLLRGDAGVGKSRLLRSLRERLGDEGQRWLEAGGSIYHEQSAFHPIVDLFEQSLQLGSMDSPELKRKTLADALQSAGSEFARWWPQFCALLGVEEGPTSVQTVGSSELQRQRTIDGLVSWFLRLSSDQPLVLVVEDLHWIDPSSSELLGALVRGIPASRTLLVMTSRSAPQAKWIPESALVELALEPLSRGEIQAMIEAITGGPVLPNGLVDEVVGRTDGVPLFVEELTKALLEGGHGEPREAADRSQAGVSVEIPSTLQDTLMARLDRLGPTKEVVQLASVLGREFSRDLLLAVSSLDADALDTSLEQLENAELLYRRGSPEASSYIFKHSLIRDTAYNSLLKATRRRFHAAIARTLTESFAETTISQPEVVARHFEEAQLIHEAVDFYAQSADRAARNAAHTEAAGHLRHAIALLSELPESVARHRRELPLQLALGARSLEASGYGDSELRLAFARARELCDYADDPALRFRTLWGLAVYHHARSELEPALELGEQCLALAESSKDTEMLIMGSLSVGCPLNWQGNWSRSLEHLERILALYDPAEHHRLAQDYGEDPGVSARIYAAQAHWQLGFSARALATIDDAVVVAERINHPFSYSYALAFAAYVYALCGDQTRTRDFARQAVALASAHDLPLWQGLGQLLLAWASRETQTDLIDTVEQMESGLVKLTATGTEVGSPAPLTLLADVYSAAGDSKRALSLLNGAEQIAERGRSPFWTPEIHRRRAALILGEGDGSAALAEAELRKAHRLALALGARSQALRAGLDLAKLLATQGKEREAHQLLSPLEGEICGEYVTPELRDARSLLAELLG